MSDVNSPKEPAPENEDSAPDPTPVNAQNDEHAPEPVSQPVISDLASI